MDVTHFIGHLNALRLGVLVAPEVVAKDRQHRAAFDRTRLRFKLNNENQTQVMREEFESNQCILC